MKDHLTLLTAMEGIRGAVLVLAGRGTDAMSRAPGVVGLGMRDDVPRLMAAADIVISSSAYGEGFSNAIAEGMASGLVPVSTDVGDVREIMGDVGFAVPVRDADALRRAVERVLVQPDAEREASRHAARERIERLFSLDMAVDRFAALYA
jgi:glycosyltransferase involved in cell wall biosynthesis